MQIMVDFWQGQDSRLKMRTFLKPASLGYGVTAEVFVQRGPPPGERAGQRGFAVQGHSLASADPI